MRARAGSRRYRPRAIRIRRKLRLVDRRRLPATIQITVLIHLLGFLFAIVRHRDDLAEHTLRLLLDLLK